MRIFCMCYFRWTVQEFEEVWNPSNGEIWVLQKIAGKGTYELAGSWRASRMSSDGKFVDVKFGGSRNERMPETMKVRRAAWARRGGRGGPVGAASTL